MGRKKLEKVTKEEIILASIKFFRCWRPESWVEERFRDAPGPRAARNLRLIIQRYIKQNQKNKQT